MMACSLLRLVTALALFRSACSDDTVGSRNPPPEASVLRPGSGLIVEEGASVSFAADELLVSVPIMGLFYALHKHLVGGLTTCAVKG